jgi:FMN phosphatase YigB (HAD superfamily)
MSLGCDAAACTYIDDIGDFVAAARAFGIKGISYSPALNLAEALRSFKVELRL